MYKHEMRGPSEETDGGPGQYTMTGVPVNLGIYLAVNKLKLAGFNLIQNFLVYGIICHFCVIL